jgi:multicomponent Na+:H+ antiporter subunit C
MTLVAALTVGVLYGAGTYLLLQRTLTRIILGLALMGHGANVLLLTAAGAGGEPPLIDDGPLPPGVTADPLPQALALTAIVITFGVVAFLLALAYRSWQLSGDDEVEDDVEDRRVAAQQSSREPAAGTGSEADLSRGGA